VAKEHLHKVTGGDPPTLPADPTAEPSIGPGSGPATGSAIEPDIEAEWARIVAGYHTTVDPTAAPWPASEELPAEPAPPPPPATNGTANHGRRRTDQKPPAEPSLVDGLDTFGADLEEDDEEEDRYIPPPPPPLPRISKYAVMGMLGVLVGFVLFLFPGLLPITQDYVTLIGFAAIVSGAVMLVWRLRSGDDDEDDYDDGAVV